MEQVLEKYIPKPAFVRKPAAKVNCLHTFKEKTNTKQNQTSTTGQDAQHLLAQECQSKRQ